MTRLLILAVCAALAGCDAAAPEPVDDCPFPVAGFAEPVRIFSPAVGDTIRVSERFFLSASYFGGRQNAALATNRDLSLTWTSADGADRRVLYDFAFIDERSGAGPTNTFIIELLIRLPGLMGVESASDLPPGGTAAVEVSIDVESQACEGRDRITLVTRNEVVLLD